VKVHPAADTFPMIGLDDAGLHYVVEQSAEIWLATNNDDQVLSRHATPHGSERCHHRKREQHQRNGWRRLA